MDTKSDIDPYRAQRQAFQTQRQAFEHDRQRRDANDRALIALLEARVTELERHVGNVNALLQKLNKGADNVA